MRRRINDFFDVLDLIIVRLTLLVLLILGAISLVSHHF